MSRARQILNEETPKEFFKRRGSGDDVSIVRPAEFGSVGFKKQFTTDGTTRYSKSFTHSAWVVKSDGTLGDGYRFSLYTMAFPITWTPQQVALWFTQHD